MFLDKHVTQCVSALLLSSYQYIPLCVVVVLIAAKLGFNGLNMDILLARPLYNLLFNVLIYRHRFGVNCSQ